MKRFGLFLLTVILSLSAVAFAQVPSPDAASEHKASEAVPLVFWNRPITIFRSYNEDLSPAERATRAVARLSNLPEVASDWKIVVNEILAGQRSGVIITVNGSLAFSILTEDLDRESGETLKTEADQATAQLRAALEARSQQRRLPVVLRGIGLSIASGVILLFGLWLVARAGRLVLAKIDRIGSIAPRRVGPGGFDFRPVISYINRGLAKLTIWAAIATLIYLWLTFALLRFPYTQPWGQQLGTFLVNLFAMLGTGLLRSIPGMFTVLVIFLLTRIVVRAVNGIFGQVEKGELHFSWLHRDTAHATQRLVVVLIWIFAVTVAYPFIPGSSSDAFKGVSVFVGLMVSLGSAGLINQVMSGLVVIYSRALRQGEFVRIGDDFGKVSEIGMLSTKLLTRKREEITIPNAVLVGTKTVNFSRHAAGDGGVVGTTMTIGYDAPWRQVHAMLLNAADQTSGVRKEPAPRVWQKSLSDFYVEYELVVNLDEPSERVPILSELHMHIQDAFNEQGVQIMVPHFEGQPNEKVFVPKSKWFTKPAGVTESSAGDRSPVPFSERRASDSSK